MLTVTATIHAPITHVRDKRNNPTHIVNRAFASDDRHCPSAINDLKVGGRFVISMAAKDGSSSFDFSGVYTAVIGNTNINYTMDDGRNAEITFKEKTGDVEVVVSFDPETINAVELQQEGRQAILDNFKKYADEQ